MKDEVIHSVVFTKCPTISQRNARDKSVCVYRVKTSQDLTVQVQDILFKPPTNESCAQSACDSVEMSADMRACTPTHTLSNIKHISHTHMRCGLHAHSSHRKQQHYTAFPCHWVGIFKDTHCVVLIWIFSECLNKLIISCNKYELIMSARMSFCDNGFTNLQ